MSRLLALYCLAGLYLVALYPALVWAQPLRCVQPQDDPTELTRSLAFVYQHNDNDVKCAKLSLSQGDNEYANVRIQTLTGRGDKAWQAAAWNAVTAVALLGYDLAFKKIIYHIPVESSDSTVAFRTEAMMALALLAVIEKESLPEEPIVGKMNPDGGIYLAESKGIKEKNAKPLTIEIAYERLTQKKLIDESTAATLSKIHTVDLVCLAQQHQNTARTISISLERERAIPLGDQRSGKSQRRIKSLEKDGQNSLSQAEKRKEEGYNYALDAIQHFYHAFREHTQDERSYQDIIPEPYNSGCYPLQQLLKKPVSLQPKYMTEFQQRMPNLPTSSSDIAILIASHVAFEHYIAFKNLAVNDRFINNSKSRAYASEAKAAVWGLHAFDRTALGQSQFGRQPHPFSQEKLKRLATFLEESANQNLKMIQTSSFCQVGSTPHESLIQVLDELCAYQDGMPSDLADATRYARLGIVIRLYLVTSALVNLMHDVDDDSEPYQDSKVKQMLQSATVIAQQAINRLQPERDVVLLRFLYQSAQQLQFLTNGQFEALLHFWEASLYARLILATDSERH